MRWNDVGQLDCSIARSLGVLGDRWTMLVVRELFLGTRRFDTFQERTGMSSNLLTQRLNRLADHGIVRRRAYAHRPPRYEYHLTDKGVDLYPIIIALKTWGDTWGGWTRRPPTKLAHRECGRSMTPTISLTCSACGDPIAARDVRVVRRPSPAPAARRDRTA